MIDRKRYGSLVLWGLLIAFIVPPLCALVGHILIPREAMPAGGSPAAGAWYALRATADIIRRSDGSDAQAVASYLDRARSALQKQVDSRTNETVPIVAVVTETEGHVSGWLWCVWFDKDGLFSRVEVTWPDGVRASGQTASWPLLEERSDAFLTRNMHPTIRCLQAKLTRAGATTRMADPERHREAEAGGPTVMLVPKDGSSARVPVPCIVIQVPAAGSWPDWLSMLN